MALHAGWHRVAVVLKVNMSTFAPMRTHQNLFITLVLCALTLLLSNVAFAQTELLAIDDGLEGLILEGELDDNAPRARFYVEGRSRLELDISRTLLTRSEVLTGLSLRARLGAEIPLAKHWARVVIGDGFRLGPVDDLPLPIVNENVARFIYELELDFDLPIFGQEGRLHLGRFAFELSDGRMLGRADFDPRGRSFDGALLDVAAGDTQWRLAAFLLESDDLADLNTRSSVALANLQKPFGPLFVDVFAIAHQDREGVREVQALSLGTELRIDTEVFDARLAGIGQAASVAPDILEPAGFGGHGAADLRLTFSSFSAQLGAEVTGGRRVEGKSFRRPAGDLHPFLGALDLTVADNVWSVFGEVGLIGEKGFHAYLKPQLIGLTVPLQPFVDGLERQLLPYGTKSPLVMFELDAALNVDLHESIYLSAEYGLGIGLGDFESVVPLQRFLVSVAFRADTLL